MKHQNTAIVKILINAPLARVWNALVNPAMIKKYLHGTDAVSDWKKGSPLTFSGAWNGKEYLDKGIILQIEKERVLSYSWLSSLSGLEDDEENYSIITYTLTPEGDNTRLELTQQNIPTVEGKQSSEKNWTSVLNALKKILESE